MPLFVSALIGGLVSAVGAIVANVMLSLGIGFVAYQGIDFMVTAFKADALSALGGNGSLFVQFMGVFQIGTAINMIASAMTARLVLAGITGGSLTKMVTKAP